MERMESAWTAMRKIPTLRASSGRTSPLICMERHGLHAYKERLGVPFAPSRALGALPNETSEGRALAAMRSVGRFRGALWTGASTEDVRPDSGSPDTYACSAHMGYGHDMHIVIDVAKADATARSPSLPPFSFYLRAFGFACVNLPH